MAAQNLHARSRELVGDRNPREHEFTVQLRSFDAAKAGAQTGFLFCWRYRRRCVSGALTPFFNDRPEGG